MSQRTQKVESLVQQIVAQQLPEILGPDAARLTITGVDVSPDLRHAIVWVGVLAGSDAELKAELEKLLTVRREFQRAVASNMTTKYVPHLEFRPDAGGEYAEYISKLLRDI